MISISSVEARAVQLLQVLQRHGVADAGHHVLALRVGQVVAVDAGPSGARVAGEGDPRARVPAQIAEDHGDHIDGGPQVGGDPLLAPVEDRPLGVPGPEDRPDRRRELLARLLRKVPAGVFGKDLLERLDQARRSSVSRSRSSVVPFARFANSSARSNASAGTSQTVLPNIWINRRYESQANRSLPPACRASPATLASVRPTLRTVSIMPGIENLPPDRTETSNGSAGSPSRRPIASSIARSRIRHLSCQRLRFGTGGEVGATGLGGDGEARRYRQAEVGHLGEVGALAAEQVLHVLVAVGEVVHVPGLAWSRHGVVPIRRTMALRPALGQSIPWDTAHSDPLGATHSAG